MIVAGITHPVGADAAFCLSIDGKLEFFLEEERVSRSKNAFNTVPHGAISFGLRKFGISINDIDQWLVGFKRPSARARFGGAYLQERLRLTPTELFDFHDSTLKDFLRDAGKVTYIDHYLSHAYSAYPFLSDQEANIICIDGWGGDYAGKAFFKTKDGLIRELFPIEVSESLGLFYQFITAKLGFKPHSQEGKTMALAAYGKVVFDLLPDFCSEESYLPDVGRYLSFLDDLGDFSVLSEFTQMQADLAATAQYYLDRALQKIAFDAYRNSGCGNFALVGGVALNCVANGRLAQMDFVENLVVPPLAGDAGTALGSVIAYAADASVDLQYLDARNAYWGPDFKNDEIRALALKCGLKFEETDPVEAAVDALLGEKVVGLFSGPAEVGPRALGARSILANPCGASTSRLVNRNVKDRETWRPFAPSILEEHAASVLKFDCATPFMTIADEVRDDWREKLSAVTHIDGSTRPQMVNESCGLYFDLIRRFHQASGVPAVLNTSFNLSDEPIVLRPDHAVASFYRSGLSTLILGDFVLKK